MLLVRVSVKRSPIHGNGCFAEEKILKGQEVWRDDERIDTRIDQEQLAKLPKSAQEFLSVYGFVEFHQGQTVVVLCGDHAKYMNHSDEPNLLEHVDGSDFAARDIEPGEELTCNYYDFDLEAGFKLK